MLSISLQVKGLKDLLHPFPHLSRGQTKVLQTEGDVRFNRRCNQRIIWVLEDHGDTATDVRQTGFRYLDAVDAYRARGRRQQAV
jgi:hypothetical protein